ncbi:MAG: hypothetical protein ABH874_01450 [Methanobacteriota archaeon]
MNDIDETERECPSCHRKFTLDTEALSIIMNIYLHPRMQTSRSWWEFYTTFCQECMEKAYPGDTSPFRRIKERIDRDPSLKIILKQFGIKSIRQLEKISNKVKKMRSVG